MDGIAQFEKVSLDQFTDDWTDAFGVDFMKLNSGNAMEEIERIYDNIQIPQRATKYSAGYDFFSPLTFELKPGETIKIPTGIRANMKHDYVLMCFPRSGLGFKYRMQLNNTVGIIDADYYYSDNEGHIFAKVTNDTNEGKILSIEAGTGFMQGVFIQYGVTVDDEADKVRNGGFGSTMK